MIPRRRVLFLFNAFSNDAPSRITWAIARGVHQAGYEVKCASWSRGGPLEAEMQSFGITTAVLGGGTLRAAAGLSRLINRFCPDIVHSILVRPNTAIPLALMMGTRHDFTWIAADHGIHEWTEKGFPTALLTQALLPGFLNRADAVVAVSESGRRDLIGKGVASNKLIVIPNGVDLRLFYPRPRVDREALLQEAFGVGIESLKTFLVGSAGNLRSLKGYDILLKAARAVIDQDPTCRFVIWGEGPEQDRLQSLTGELGLRNHVFFAGHHPHLEHRFPLLDLYVQPSRTESFGLAAAEAMACGVPAILSNTGGLRSLVDHDHSGLTFHPGDAASLADNILMLRQRSRKRTKMAEAGRLQVMQRFSQQGMIDAVLTLYESLLKAREK